MSATTLRPSSVITNGSMSGNLISSVTVLQSLTSVSYTVNWAGTSPVGTLSIQFSDDYSLLPNGNVNNTGTWSTAFLDVNGTGSSTIAVSGNTGNEFIDILQASAYAVRLIYSFQSGTGTMNAIVNGKVM